MASVELSAGVMSGLPSRVIFPGTGRVVISGGVDYISNPLLPYQFEWNNGTIGASIGIISVYQGVVPTDFSTLTLYNSRSADILVSYNASTAGMFNLTVNVSVNPAVINTSYNTATATGIATWFRWMVHAPSGGSFFIAYQIIGTVGATGSGADLEIPSTSIVSGRAYRIQNLRIQFPSSWSY